MSQRMTKKQALAVLHTALSVLYESANYYKPEHEELRTQVLPAMSVLIQSIHGTPPPMTWALCDQCHLCYGPHWVEYLQEHEWGDYTRLVTLCSSCLEQAKQTLEIVSLDWEPFGRAQEAGPLVLGEVSGEDHAAVPEMRDA